MCAMACSSSVILGLILLHDVAASQPIENTASTSFCADKKCALSDDDFGGSNFLLQTQVQPSNIQKKAGFIHAFRKIRGDDPVAAAMDKWPQPDDPKRKVTIMDELQAQQCKDIFSKKNPEVHNTSVPCCLALAPPEFNVKHGIHDILFQILELYPDEKYQWVRQWAWRGLSDNCMTEVGSESIANIGGPNKGVEYMVKQLLVNPPYAGMCDDHVDIQYEILADLGGLLAMDNNNTRAPAAMEAGLVQAMVRSFTIEPDFRPVLNFACRAMSYAMFRNPQYARLFRDAGLLELVNRSIETLQIPDNTEFHFGVTVSEYFNPDACLYPQLMMMGDAASKAQADALMVENLDFMKSWKPWATIKV